VDYGVGSANNNNNNNTSSSSSSSGGNTYNSSNTATTTTTLDKLDNEESALSNDIQRTISQMNELINTKMSPSAECTGRAQHALLVRRYREIVFDCGAEYGKTRAGIARRREARELFSNATAGGGGLGGGGGNEADRQLLRERNAIDNSMNGASSVLNQAAYVRAELRNQGLNLRGISGTMGRIASHVPGLNAIIDKIRKKRLQDDRVVGGVVAMCILFTLWYLFG
jgi:Golgi SNAP receptor complex protein 1